MTASEEPPSTRRTDSGRPSGAVASTSEGTLSTDDRVAARVNGHQPSTEPAPPLGQGRLGEPPVPPVPPVRLSQTRFRTFQTIIDVPIFRWYLLSMVGNFSAMQMQMLARGFLTYELTGSFAALGTIELANTMPRLVFALGGGVVADRRNRRAITQIGQMVNAMVAVVLSSMLLLGVLRFEYLVIATVLQGIVNSFALPARQAMIPEIVGTERLTNALALNVSLMSTLRLGAPALAGFLIAVVGAAWVFALMGVLYTISSLTLFKVPLHGSGAGRPGSGATSTAGGRAGRAGASGAGSAVKEIRDALVYLWRIPVLRMVLIVDMFLGMLTFPYQRLLPGFVAEVLSSDSDQAAVRLGLLLTATAVGALAGSLVVASLPNKHRGKLVIASVVLFGVALLAFSVSTVFYVSLGIVAFMGVGQAARQALNNILIQTHTSNEFRGRISSIMLFEDGVESLGIFAIAMIASVWGPQFALAFTAACMLGLGAAMALLMPSYRRLD